MTIHRKTIFSAALTASLLVMAGCSQDDGSAESASVSGGGDANGLLAYVPAGTPYVAANLERTPDDVLDTWWKRLGPMLDAVQDELHAARMELEAEGREPEDFDALIEAWLAEFDGKLNREGIRSLGFADNAWEVLYGMGAFPVVRFELADAEALRATVQRVAERAGQPSEPQLLDGTEYWKFADETEAPVGAYIAILDDHLVGAMLPLTAEAEWLPALLGQTMPGESLSTAALISLNEDRGYTDYGTGYVDIAAMVEEFVDPARPTASHLGQLDDAWLTQDPQCVEDMRRMAAVMPMVTYGTTELTGDSVAWRMDMDFEPNIAAAMQGLAIPVPLADDDPSRVVSFSLGVSVAYLREFLISQANAITANPFGCEELQQINVNAQEALIQLEQPMMPLIANFRGIRASLDTLPVGGGYGTGEAARGVMAIQMDQPQMLVGMGQMFLPQLAEIQIVPDAEPVALPEDVAAMAGDEVYAAMTDQALGFAVSAGEAGNLLPFLQAPVSENGTILSVNYDAAKVGHLEDEILDNMDFSDMNDADAAEFRAEMAKSQAFSEMWNDMMDRTIMDLRVTERGMAVEQLMTFDPVQ